MLSTFFSQGIACRFWGEADGRAVKTGSKVKSLFDTFINQLPSGTQLLVFVLNENGLIDQKTKPTVLYSPEDSEGLVKGEFICNPLKLWHMMKTCGEDICRGFWSRIQSAFQEWCFALGVKDSRFCFSNGWQNSTDLRFKGGWWYWHLYYFFYFYILFPRRILDFNFESVQAKSDIGEIWLVISSVDSEQWIALDKSSDGCIRRYM